MHPEQIKALVRMSGVTLTALAIKADLSESACRNALRKRSGRADQAIADQIGKSLEDIWPSRYATRHERDQNSRSGAEAHRLTAQAV
jgi:lambda repressor-like predicted transcriptional regulator